MSTPTEPFGGELARSWSVVDRLLAGSSPRVVSTVLGLHRRLIEEAVANVLPIRPEAQQPLLPARRRFLAGRLSTRLTNAEEALDELTRSGITTPTIETVLALHGELVDESTAERGRIRGGAIGFQVGNDFGGARPELCHELTVVALHQFADGDAPTIDRAAALAATLMKIHPFSDGNGRVARAVFHVATSAAGAIRPDVDLWSPHRLGYLDALIASDPVGPVTLGHTGDPSPFVRWVRDLSSHGADLWRGRIELIATLDHRLGELGFDAVERTLALAVIVDRNVSPDELATREPQGAPRERALASLTAAGVIRWDARGVANPTDSTNIVVRAAGRRGRS